MKEIVKFSLINQGFVGFILLRLGSNLVMENLQFTLPFNLLVIVPDIILATI